MARLFAGEKELKQDDVLQLLRAYDGLSEVEIADMLGWDRRTANNYLRELMAEWQVYKEGRLWFTGEQ